MMYTSIFTSVYVRQKYAAAAPSLPETHNNNNDKKKKKPGASFTSESDDINIKDAPVMFTTQQFG